MTRSWADYPHVRIYSSVMEDEKFDNVRDNDAAFAWYVRLLFVAHAAHPAPGYLPRVPRKVLATLQDAGLIAVNGSRFTMSGVATERSEVADLGHRAGGTVRAATAERDESGRFAPAAGPPLDQRAGPAPSSSDGTYVYDVQDYDGRDDIEAYVEVRRRAPTPGQRKVLDNVLARHDVNGAKWAADIIRANPHDPIGAVIEADNRWRLQRKIEAVTEERKAEVKKRGLRDPLQQELAKAYVERYGEPESHVPEPVVA